MSRPPKVEVVYPTRARPGAPDPPTFTKVTLPTITTLGKSLTDEDTRRLIIERLLGKRTWDSAELRGMFTVEEIAQRLAPLLRGVRG